MATEPSDDDLEKTYVYHQLDEYPWTEDHEFQGGLRAILGSVSDPERVEHLTLRAKCYYYARKAGTAVDFEGYKQWVESLRASSAPNGSFAAPNATLRTVSDVEELSSGSAEGVGGLGDAPKPASFAEICDLIAQGKPIPGIKDIPDTILEGQSTESHAPKRKKPWEAPAQSQATKGLSWMK